VRQKLRQADAKTHVACLAEKPTDFAAALEAKDADWVYVRYVPSAEEASKVHAAGKRLFIAGPTVAGREAANWKQAASAGIDGILTDYPLELAELLRGERGQ
jgi:glycerophosphoryl diester phosphodiesterase